MALGKDLKALLAEVEGPKVQDLDHLTLWNELANAAQKHLNNEAVVSLWQHGSDNHSENGQGEHPRIESNGTSLPGQPSCIRWTYDELMTRVDSLSKCLRRLECTAAGAISSEQERQPQPTMQLAVLLWNSAEWALFFWAAAQIGMAFVPIDPRSPEEAREMLALLRPRVIVAQDEAAAAILAADSASSPSSYTDFDGFAGAESPDGGVAGSSCRIQCSGTTAEGWIDLSELLLDPAHSATDKSIIDSSQLHEADASPSAASADSARPQPSDTALIIFTSGTTGTPKGCVHSNANIVSQISDYDPNEDPSVRDKWLVHTPTSHIFAVNNALRAWKTGDAVVFASRSFDVASTVRALTQERCTIMSGTPTLAKILMAHPDFPGPDSLDLSLVTLAAANITQEDIEFCRHGLGARNVIQAYGLSEGAPLASWSRRDPLLVEGYHAGVGKVLPGTSLRVCDVKTGQVVLLSQVGELQASGTSVISNYLHEAQPESFCEDEHGRRWFKTGDKAMIDRDGAVHIIERYKDIIIRGGLNVSPQKIEAALDKIPGVQAHVVGVPDDIAGQVPIAVVDLSKAVSKHQIIAEATHLGPQYALGGVFTLYELGFKAVPRTSLGKVKKEILKAAVLQRRALKTSLNGASGASHDTPSMNNSNPLLVELLDIWEELTGSRPSPQERVAYSADSITILRYCDRVWRVLGRRVYIQDMGRHDTLEKQANMLSAMHRAVEGEDSGQVKRKHGVSKEGVSALKTSVNGTGERANGLSITRSTPSKSPSTTSSSQRLSTARRKLHDLGLELSQLEDICSIRANLHRTASGLRPRSFHVRMVFRIQNIPETRIRAGLEAALTARPMSRTIICGQHGNEDGELLHAVVRPSRELFARLIHTCNVDTEEEAKTQYEYDILDDAFSAYMFQANITFIRETQQYMLSITHSHSTIDALSLFQWHQSLDRLISDGSVRIPPSTPYRLFTELFDEYHDSLYSKNAILSYTQRLRGISRFKKALWPEQKAPGWMLANDEDSPHADERQIIREKIWNGAWESRAAEFKYPRQGRVVCLPQLSRLRQLHDVPPSIFAKCAVILFNVIRTKSSHAILTTWESGRSWPFVPDWIAERLPPAMSIDGPTVQWVLDMIEVDSSETITDFLKRIMALQENIERYQHAPWEKVLEELREEGPVAVDASYRQSFIWDVSLGLTASEGFRGDLQVLEPIARYDWADYGFCWNAFMIDTENLYFIASWDTAQMNAEDVEGHCDMLAEVMRKMGREENWDWTVGAVFGL